MPTFAEKLLAFLKALGIDVEAKKSDIEKGLKDLEPAQPTPVPVRKDPSAPENAETQALRQDLAAMQQQFKDLMGALGEEKKQREAAQKAFADQMKTEKEKKVADTLTKHEKAGQIPPAMKDHYKKLLELDFDSALKIIEALPVDPAAKKAADAADKKDGKTPDGKQAEGEPKVRTLESMAPTDILQGIAKLSPSN